MEYKGFNRECLEWYIDKKIRAYTSVAIKLSELASKDFNDLTKKDLEDLWDLVLVCDEASTALEENVFCDAKAKAIGYIEQIERAKGGKPK